MLILKCTIVSCSMQVLFAPEYSGPSILDGCHVFRKKMMSTTARDFPGLEDFMLAGFYRELKLCCRRHWETLFMLSCQMSILSWNSLVKLIALCSNFLYNSLLYLIHVVLFVISEKWCWLLFIPWRLCYTHVFVCLLASSWKKNCWLDLRENFITDVFVDKKELIEVWKSSISGFGCKTFWRILRRYEMGHCFTFWHISVISRKTDHIMKLVP